MAAPMDLELLTSSDAETTLIAGSLVDIGCCPRCVLRYLGEKRPWVYKANQEDLRKLVCKLCEEDDQSTYGSSGTTPCPVCLGILEDFCCTDFLQKIKQCVDKNGYEFVNYQCSLSLPVSNILREHALTLHLGNKFDYAYHGLDDEAIPSVKDVWKWFSGPELSRILGSSFQLKSQFDISVNFTHDDAERECNFLLDVQPHIFRRRKVKKFDFETFTRTNVAKAVREISDGKFQECYTCPPARPANKCRYQLGCSHESVFIAGRYNKYSRHLSQTPWIVDGGRKSETSVQELLCEIILDKFKPTDHKLSSSGREDVDVRMLGTGRPFVVELINPHVVKFSAEDLKTIQQDTNSLTKDVAISDLQIVPREDTANLKEGEIEKSKTYSALCWSETELQQEQLDKLKELTDLKLDQKTPLRVLHRRPLASRLRVIHNMHAEKVNKHHFRLYLSTQAGTYIKEFVHGDFGRTTPNLSILLGVECDILELDVEAVNVEWPPRLS
ncbi:tRNA pseudouridine synthase Pus10-like [Haliotis rufescens]|uniref:tRNA pseudouridine synthase Pus10-like n=1 Tax=Haliotis rufescens TaxID=6454 RepID=UPI00201EB200|nr:tRNA pseudouridine synthase Pus10-like [Haliotis rufescens]